MRRRLHLIRHHSANWFRRLTGAVGTLELSVLAAAAIVAVGSWGFIAIADRVVEGETQKVDEQIMRALRRADNPSVPIGPEWLQTGALDITGLGGDVVLSLVTVAVAGFILLHRRYGALILVLLAASGAGFLNFLLKNFFARERPTIVPRLVTVFSKSFPSGHAMASAAVYLSLAVLLSGITLRKRDRAYILAVALALTFLIGVSRVYLGVHYPTDVLAGWTAGIVWAMVCWLAVRITPRLLATGSRVVDAPRKTGG